MSNGNERNDIGEVTTPNFAEQAKIPQQHSNFPINAKQLPQVAISNWVNSCGRQDDMTIEDIVDACWLLQPVVDYLRYLGNEFATPEEIFKKDVRQALRKQIIRSFIRQALISYIDNVVVASVPKA